MTKFIVGSATLLKQLERLKGALATDAIVPIQQNYLFELQAGELRLTASSLAVRLSAALEVESAGEGRLAVPARQLLDVLKHMADQPLTFTLDTDVHALSLQAGANAYRLAGEDARGYPLPPDFEEVGSFQMAAGRLQRALEKTISFASSDSMHSPLDGVQLRVTSRALEFAAGHPLQNIIAQYQQSFASVQWASKPFEGAVAAPARYLKVLLSLLPKTSEPVGVHLCVRHLMVQVGGLLFSCRLSDGNFPPLINSIPKGNANVYVAERGEFTGAMRRFSGFVDEKTQAVRFQFKPTNSTISAQPLDGASEASEALTGEYAGEPLVIGLRLSNVLQALPHLDGDGEQVTMSMSTHDKGVLLTPAKLLEGERMRIWFTPLMLNI